MNDPMFHCENLPAVGDVARLGEDESRHAAGARRLKPGDALCLFDGRGGIARAHFLALQDRGRILEAMVEERQQQPATATAIQLAFALPKGDRTAVLIDMATQLGATSFVPLLCERSVVEPGQGTLDRLRRVALEACKQSRRAYLPTIHAPAKFADVAAGGGSRWIAHPGGKAVSQLGAPTDSQLTLLIGPEGGFSDDEVRYAVDEGAVPVSLGEGILRVETAAVALLAAIVLGPTFDQAS